MYAAEPQVCEWIDRLVAIFSVEAFPTTLEKFRALMDACGLRYHLTDGVVGNALGEPEEIE